MSNYQFFEENTEGRDFIVGDIHGCFDRLDSALKKINFDPYKDRLFSIGDLIDRGPQSKRCLEFIQRQSVHVIRGNHEDIFLNIFRSGDMNLAEVYQNFQNGMGWMLDADKKLRKHFQSCLLR